MEHPVLFYTVLRLAQHSSGTRKTTEEALRVLATVRKALRGLTTCAGGEAPKTHSEVLSMNNQFNCIGRIGQQPRAVSFPDTGNKVVKFSIAIADYTAKSDDDDDTLWIDCDAWNGLGERVLQTITKGREVFLSGRLVINKFTRDENGKTIEVHKPVLKLTSFHLCGPKPAASNVEETGEKKAKCK
jgi:single-stranded DNA-binding protein